MRPIRYLWIVAALGLLALCVALGILLGWTATAIIVVFAILPDIALIGAFDPEAQGRLRTKSVPFYNALHRIWLPLTILIAGALAGLLSAGSEGGDTTEFFRFPTLGSTTNDLQVFLLLAAIAWFLHIAADRACGFGLREDDGTIRPVGGYW